MMLKVITEMIEPQTFLSDPPIVTLAGVIEEPYNLAIAAARTCYSSSGILTTKDVVKDERARKLRDRIAESTLKAGHLTTRQHASFVFALDRISRHFIWSFLHSHPFYNCVSGDTEIPHFHANDKEPWTIAELYARFQDPGKRRYIEKMHIRSVDQEGNLVPNKIKEVLATGIRPIFKVKTALGYCLKATQDHRFMKKDRSWSRLYQLKVGDLILVNGVRLYKDPAWLKTRYHEEGLSQRQIARLASTTPWTIRKWVMRFKLQKPFGSWSRGVSPPQKGQTKETYPPLKKVSEWAKAVGHRPPPNGRGTDNNNWKGIATKNPRDRARLWYSAEVCEVCGATRAERRIERHHINKDIYDNSRENIIILCSLCHKAAESPHRTIMRVTVDRIVSIEPDGEAETFDLVMEAPRHNFIANGFVVHNSEQVSQRYVKVAPGHFTIPPLEAAQEKRYRETVQLQMDRYNQLIELLMPDIRRRFFRLFPARVRRTDAYESTLKKRGYEIARYLLPIATHAYMYHTVSALTLLRYWRISQMYDTPHEQRYVVGKMIESVKAVDPDFAKEVKDPFPLEETPECRFFEQRGTGNRRDTKAFLSEFDASLEGHVSKLFDYKRNAEAVLAQSVRDVLGSTRSSLSDDEAIELVMNPEKNRYFGDTLNLTTLSKLTRSMVHPHYTFRKKISHTADSQDQRHRMTPGSRPVLFAHYSGEPDYVLPMLVRESGAAAASGAAREVYEKTMAEVFRSINELLDDGVKPEFALYLLPNAFPIRFEESGDLLNLHHKWRTRACYDSQEEIFFATIDEIRQVKAIHPRIASHILAPCYLRMKSNERPYCPEGDRYCGVPVWKQPIEGYRGRIL